MQMHSFEEAANHSLDWWEEFNDVLSKSIIANDCRPYGEPEWYKQFLQGFMRYKKIVPHSYRPEAPIVQTINHVTLRDYGALYGVSVQAKPILIIPSLINQGYIFDLCSGFSVLDYLVQQQLHPFVIDWGGARGLAQEHRLEDYVTQAVLPFVETVKRLTLSSKVSVLGYCMGGLLALAAGQTSRLIDRLVLLATPWDFHQGTLPFQRHFVVEMVKQELQRNDYLSSFCLQLFFYLIDPLSIISKFCKFAQMPEATPEFERFIALENWVNDTSPLNRTIAEEIFLKWYGENSLVVSKKLFGHHLNRQIPTLLLSAARDRIVPPSSARGLTSLLPQATYWEAPLGHVGLLISKRAIDLVWQPLVDWLKLK